MDNVHIELSHIYQDSFIDKEQLDSLNILKNTDFCEQNSIISVLVDDYNIENKKWELDYLIDFFEDNNVNIDFIFYESKFKNLVNTLIKSLPENNLKIERFKKDNKKVLFFVHDNIKIPLKTIFENYEKYTCVALSTCWKLSKLGYFKFPKDSYVSFSEKKLESKNTLTILSEKFSKVENSVCYLINFLENSLINKVNYIYY